MKVWIIGGAGYIRSTIARAGRPYRITLVIVDDLISGHFQATAHLPFYLGDVTDLVLIQWIVADRGRPQVVVQIAGPVSAGGSMTEPIEHYQTKPMKTPHLRGFLIECIGDGWWSVPRRPPSPGMVTDKTLSDAMSQNSRVLNAGAARLRASAAAVVDSKR